MSELGPFSEALDPSAFILGVMGEGMGVSEARDLFRSYGMSISNQRFSNLWGDIASTVGNRDAIQGLDYGAVPDAAVYTPWAAGVPDEFATFVQVQYVMPGSDEIQTAFRTYVTSDPHTPGEAADWATDSVNAQAAEGGTLSGARPLGAIVSSMTRTVARR